MLRLGILLSSSQCMELRAFERGNLRAHEGINTQHILGNCLRKVGPLEQRTVAPCVCGTGQTTESKK